MDSIIVRGHSRTREEIILRELLFATGAPLDSALIRETERNLRRLAFLGNAHISILSPPAGTTPHPDRVQLVIQVEDLYSRALSPVFSGELEELSYAVEGVDYNFLGRGQVARFDLRHSPVSGNSGSIGYRMPRLGDSHTTLATSAGIGEEGHVARMSLSQSYFSLSSSWAFGLSAFSAQSLRRLYSEGRLATRYEERLEGGSASIGHSYTTSSGLKIRPRASMSVSERRFRQTRDFTFVPADRRRVVTNLALTLWRPRYHRARFVRSLGSVEDLQTGSWAVLQFGMSHRVLGSDRSFPILALQLSPRVRLPNPETYVFMTLLASSRWRQGSYDNVITSSQIQGYVRVKGETHTLAFRLRLDTLNRPEDDAQFLLGVDRGLRGYAPRSLDGRRRLLLNAELRPTLYARPSYVVAAALFADAGTAWTPGEGSPDLKTSVGVGGRLGLPRIYDTPVLRADVARSLGDGIWQLSFGIGQYF